LENFNERLNEVVRDKNGVLSVVDISLHELDELFLDQAHFLDDVMVDDLLSVRKHLLRDQARVEDVQRDHLHVSVR
jgi:hypothetical protein